VTDLPTTKDQVSLEYPHLVFERPTSHYLQNEKFAVAMLPSATGEFDVLLAPKLGNSDAKIKVVRNRIVVEELPPKGQYFFKARWRSDAHRPWSPWSPPLRFTVHNCDENIAAYLEEDHRLSLMLERGTGGVVTLIDPDAEPPGRVGLSSAKWFATPVYEGATPLVNEDPEYYRDPWAYYFNSIDQLVRMGASFLTWHDVLNRQHNQTALEILLQFDVDGGPKSMHKMYDELAKRGIRASLMIHRRGHHWYPYELSGGDLEWMKEAESNGWAIGYHNNSLSQVIGDGVGAYGETKLQEAAAIFAADVLWLRRYFDVQTFTHHGGNTYNLTIMPPKNIEIIGVDRASTPSLWESISSMYSDGGFVSRPSTLREKVTSLSAGLHFFRNHPYKYGNYSAPVDVPPRFAVDLHKVSLKATQETVDWQKRELAKEASWLKQRQASRSDVRLAYLHVEKPISSQFSPYRDVEERISRLRKHRRDSFLRLYPWAEGDPRVFWWRMLEAVAPKQGELLNVGALPPGQKHELREFLSPSVALIEMDIDPEGVPDYVIDICDAPDSLTNRFAGALLFGLPYFASPSEAVAACARVTSADGLGLFGFVADTHPTRGSIFHPQTRHLWRKEKEPLTGIGLNRNSWAFDREGIRELFQGWKTTKIEAMGHYWFVLGSK
jgi:hypothetical protein